MATLKLLYFAFVCCLPLTQAVLSTTALESEDEAGPVEFTSELLDVPLENNKNASIVTAEEIEIRVPYNRNHISLYNPAAKASNFSLNTTESAQNINTTSNVTESKVKTKVECLPRTFEENEIPQVFIANSSKILKVLAPVGRKNDTAGHCVVVLFYSNQCVFSARMAPHFNALPRVFPDIAFYAVDVSEAVNLYVRYGLIYVPNIMLFHNSKPFARYNETAPNLDLFVKFINKNTGLEFNGTLNVTSQDMSGPVPSHIIRRVDWILILAWAFTLACLCFGFTRTAVCRRTVDFLRNTWHEANAATHEHED